MINSRMSDEAFDRALRRGDFFFTWGQVMIYGAIFAVVIGSTIIMNNRDKDFVADVSNKCAIDHEDSKFIYYTCKDGVLIKISTRLG